MMLDAYNYPKALNILSEAPKWDYILGKLILMLTVYI